MVSGFRCCAVVWLFVMAVAVPVAAQPPGQGQGQRPGGAATSGAPQSIEERTKDLRKLDGFFPLYWDETGGRLWMEIPALNTEVLYSTGLATGLGSNDIGLDRGVLTGSRIVHVRARRAARADGAAELPLPRETENEPRRSACVTPSRGPSSGASPIGGRPATGCSSTPPSSSSATTTRWPGRLQPGTYRFEANRSSVYMPGTRTSRRTPRSRPS
jgi:hypothetical protein